MKKEHEVFIKKCPECNINLDDLENGYYRCSNCETLWIVADNKLKFVPDVNGFVMGDFDGDIGDVFILGENNER